MELVELSSQLKTFDIQSKNMISDVSWSNEDRRLTRSARSLPKSCVRSPVSDCPVEKQRKKACDSQDEIKKIYFDNKVKLVHKNLETIFEDPMPKKGSTVYLGARKQKRSIALMREFRVTTKQKSKNRKMRMKRLGMKGKLLKISDDEFQQRMLSIERFINDDDPLTKDCDMTGNEGNIDKVDSINVHENTIEMKLM